jgi:hypothetical protein|nr:MAG TPA: hypothetical protein [Caudoviricetes sp.]
MIDDFVVNKMFFKIDKGKMGGFKVVISSVVGF